ncbi:MAG: DUF1501 domain-containing protein [Bdellovibrionales bacterium]|nr:DUF1501 domain-containing protein [Bdellovibrionales bacterium]
MAKKSVNRRGFLKLAAAGTCSSIIPTVTPGLLQCAMAQAAGSGKMLCVIELGGGANTFNIIPTFGGQHHDNNQGVSVAPNNPNILPINSEIYMHPALGNIHRNIMNGDGVIINGVGFPNHSRSHDVAQLSWKTGDLVNFMNSDGLGNRLSCQFPSAYSVISVSGNSDFVDGGCPNARAVNGLASLTRNTWRESSRDQFSKQAADTLKSLSGRGIGPQEAFVRNSQQRANDAAEQLETIRNTPLLDQNGATINFPNGLGSRLRDIARFFSARSLLGTAIAFASQGGYDTHGDEGPRLQSLLTELDGAIGAFERACKGLGIWQDVTVMIVSEFARTAVKNDANGNDHGMTMKYMMVGGGVNGTTGGRVIAPAPTEAELLPANLRGGRIYDVLHVDQRNIWEQALNHIAGGNAGLFSSQNFDRTFLNLFR